MVGLKYLKFFVFPVSLLFAHPGSSYADLVDDILDSEPKIEAKKKKAEKKFPKKASEAKKETSQNQNLKKDTSKTDNQQNVNKEKKKDDKKQNAQKAKENEKLPVTFQGDELSGFKKQGTLELHNNVIVQQGDFLLRAKHAIVYFRAQDDEVDRVVADGQVQISKIDPKTGDQVRSQSESAEFKAIEREVVLLGDAQLIRGNDHINGHKIRYNLDTGWVKASKVKGIVQPSEQKSSIEESK